MRRLAMLCLGVAACGDAGPATSPGVTSSGDTTASAPSSTGEPPAPTMSDVDTDVVTGTSDASTSTTSTSTSDASSTSTSDPSTTDPSTGAALEPVPLRALFINVGNASPQFNCWEYKLCREQDVEHVRDYIATWQPDVIALSEVLRGEQLTGTAGNGPILPPGYTGICGESRHRDTDELAAWDAEDASHEHECVAWNTARVALVDGSPASVYGADGCNYDFTGFRARVRLDDAHELTVVAVHPDSMNTDCRKQEIARYWSELADGERTLIGGDWNTDSDAELQRPPGFAVAYLRGQHWRLAEHDGEYSAEYAFGLQKKKFDHAFVDFGEPVTGTLSFGSALGGHDDHPRADAGDGLDHRQLLVDLRFTP